eukprot:GEMP01010092.1.p1 GENE.GEMP01010092.1~~GEMP01010092.1.p1  ORF type:complete len:562 (+),score=124.76 GEMP01010092.1:494-2179(+)
MHTEEWRETGCCCYNFVFVFFRFLLTVATPGSDGNKEETTVPAADAENAAEKLLGGSSDDDDVEDFYDSDDDIEACDLPYGGRFDDHIVLEEENDEGDVPLSDYNDAYDVGHIGEDNDDSYFEEEDSDDAGNDGKEGVRDGKKTRQRGSGSRELIVVDSESASSFEYFSEEEEEDFDDDEEETSGDGLAVELDKDWRPAGVSPVPALAKPGGFTSSLLSFSEDLLAKLKENANIAAAKNAGDKQYSSGATYWVDATDEPKNNYEALALNIFKHHTEGVDYDAARSGAEWWTVIMDDDAEVGLHWDRDYAMEEDTEVQIHPHLGTVLYLCTGGQPTVLFPCPSTVCSTETVEPMSTCPPWVSYPKVGKLITFDGRLLHGAFQAMTNEKASNGQRIVFLANIWLNWKPIAVQRFEGTLPLDDAVKEVTWSAGSECKEVQSSTAESQTDAWDFKTNGSRYRVAGVFPNPKTWGEGDNFVLTDAENKWTISGPFAIKKLKINPPGPDASSKISADAMEIVQEDKTSDVNPENGKTNSKEAKASENSENQKTEETEKIQELSDDTS